jgi:hypothetical protein
MYPLAKIETAIHEAGHACVALALGWRVEKINTRAHSSGDLYSSGGGDVVTFAPPESAHPDHERMLVLAGGGLAVAYYGREYLHVSEPDIFNLMESDRQDFDILARRVHLTFGDAWAWAVPAVVTILERDWPVVQCIMDALLQTPSLDRADLRRLLTCGVCADRTLRPRRRWTRPRYEVISLDDTLALSVRHRGRRRRCTVQT